MVSLRWQKPTMEQVHEFQLDIGPDDESTSKDDTRFYTLLRFDLTIAGNALTFSTLILHSRLRGSGDRTLFR